MTSVEQTLADLFEAVTTFYEKNHFLFQKVLNGFDQRKTIVYTCTKPYYVLYEI